MGRVSSGGVLVFDGGDEGRLCVAGGIGSNKIGGGWVFHPLPRDSAPGAGMGEGFGAGGEGDGIVEVVLYMCGWGMVVVVV